MSTLTVSLFIFIACLSFVAASRPERSPLLNLLTPQRVERDAADKPDNAEVGNVESASESNDLGSEQSIIGGNEVMSRKKRGVLGNLEARIMNIVTFPFRFIVGIVNLPVSFLRNVMYTITMPLRLGSKAVRMPYHMLFGGKTSNKSNKSNNTQGNSTQSHSVEDNSNSTMFEALTALGKSTMQAMNGGSSDDMMNLGLQMWDMLKVNVLPVLDDYIVQYQDSDMLSDDVKKYLKQFHNTYKMMHMFKMM